MTNKELRRRDTDKFGPYVQQVALDNANKRIAELEKITQWQSMESAPKHKEVLVWREDCGAFIAQLTTPDNVMSDEDIEKFFPDDFGDFEEWYCEPHGWQEANEKPTYWMPLPKPPQVKQDE